MCQRAIFWSRTENAAHVSLHTGSSPMVYRSQISVSSLARKVTNAERVVLYKQSRRRSATPHRAPLFSMNVVAPLTSGIVPHAILKMRLDGIPHDENDSDAEAHKEK
jgi:hypothetical protein